MTLGYLQVHQNPNSSVRADGRRYWGYPTRRAAVQIIAVHTAETSPTLESAEAIAGYFTRSTRAASYHEVVDANSHVVCLPPEATAFGAVGWNARGWHLSFATHARLWGDNPQWDDAALHIGAARARLAAVRHGIPARRISLAQAERGVKGFIDHARLDPGRRSDPGAGFPWGRFLDLVEDDQQEDIVASKQELVEVIRANPDKQLRERANQAVRLAELGAAGTVAQIRAEVGLPPDPESDALWVQRVRDGDEGVDYEHIRERLEAKAASR